MSESLVHIYWKSNRFLRKRYVRCPTDECITEFVVRFEAYHGDTWMCCKCGDSWSDEGLNYRPFERDWRKKAASYHRRLWDLATHGPSPTYDDLYAEPARVGGAS